MNIADAISGRDPSARLLWTLWCDCGSQRSLAGVYAWTDGKRYLWIPGTRMRRAESGRFVTHQRHSVDVDGEPWDDVEAVVCRHCQTGYLFANQPIPWPKGWLVSRYDDIDEHPVEWSKRIGHAVVSFPFDPDLATNPIQGLFVVRLGRGVFGAVAP